MEDDKYVLLSGDRNSLIAKLKEHGIICCIEPAMINPAYVNGNSVERELNANAQLSRLISVAGKVTRSKKPAALLLTQSDLLKETTSLFRPDIDVMTEFLLEDNTEELWRQYRENQVGLPTKIELYHREGTELVPYEFFFPSGAVSVIGAPTNHGKSKALQSIALDALGSLEEGETLLYITYEENELNVNKQFLNAYANIVLTAKGKKGSNLKSITEYLSEGKETWIRTESLQPFKNKEEEWKNIRRSRKIKIVKPDDNYLETLIGLIEYAIKHLSIKAIFVDYVQEIYVRDWSKYSRTDELKEAMVRLDATAQKTSVPIILAAQLKRETNSPLDLYNQYIADSGWIERKASEILLIWSNKERCKGENQEKTIDRIKNEIEKDLGKTLDLGEGGKLYFKLTKSRVLPSGSHAIIPINGNTGRVGEKLEPQQGEIFQEGGSPLSKFINTANDNNVKIDPEAQKPYRKSKDEEEEVEEAEAQDIPLPTKENNEELPF